MFVFMASSDAFASEIENGTIKCVLLRPIGRGKAFISKIAAVWLFALINLLASFAVMAAARIIFQGSVAGLGDIFAAYVISSAPMIPFAAMGAFIAVAVGSSTMSMFVSIIAYMLMIGATLWRPSAGAALFTSHLGFYKLFLGISLNVGAVANTSLLIVSSASLLALGGFALFDRKQL
jgi:ABC-2 type transport system permease protein